MLPLALFCWVKAKRTYDYYLYGCPPCLPGYPGGLSKLQLIIIEMQCPPPSAPLHAVLWKTPPSVFWRPPTRTATHKYRWLLRLRQHLASIPFGRLYLLLTSWGTARTRTLFNTGTIPITPVSTDACSSKTFTMSLRPPYGVYFLCKAASCNLSFNWVSHGSNFLTLFPSIYLYHFGCCARNDAVSW